MMMMMMMIVFVFFIPKRIDAISANAVCSDTVFA
jgi:hypothetical protein